MMRIFHLLKGYVHGYEVKETHREKKTIDRKKEDSIGGEEIEASRCISEAYAGGKKPQATAEYLGEIVAGSEHFRSGSAIQNNSHDPQSA
jgi:hypothetical protein